MSSNVSVNKEVMTLCARVLEYDPQLWMLYGQLPQELRVSLAFFVKRKDGGTRLCIPKDENDNFSLAVIFAFS